MKRQFSQVSGPRAGQGKGHSVLKGILALLRERERRAILIPLQRRRDVEIHIHGLRRAEINVDAVIGSHLGQRA